MRIFVKYFEKVDLNYQKDRYFKNMIQKINFNDALRKMKLSNEGYFYPTNVFAKFCCSNVRTQGHVKVQI